MLTTFQLVNNDRIISPALTTIREYGTWFEDTFDKYTAQMELYMKSKKKTGESVLEWHPGTRIGYWFDSTPIFDEKYKCWFIMQDSPMMARLVKLNLAEQKDAIPISVNDKAGRRMLRTYTVDQLQLYIRTTMDKSFNISEHLGIAKQIKVRDCDMDKIIMPKVDLKRKTLF